VYRTAFNKTQVIKSSNLEHLYLLLGDIVSDALLTNSFGRFLGGGSPTYGVEVFRQSEEAMVLPGIRPHLYETATSHHVLEAC
jgi:hypothetical protein